MIYISLENYMVNTKRKNFRKVYVVVFYSQFLYDMICIVI